MKQPATKLSSLERKVLAGILALAVLLRVVWVLGMRSNPYFLDPQLDQRFFVQWGLALANGEPVAEAPFVRAPLYAWFLGLVFRLFGEGLFVVHLIQALLGTVSVFLTFLIGRRVFSIRAGLASAFMAATYWVFLYYDNELLRASGCLSLNLLGVYATLRAAEGGRSRGLLAGLAWGLSALLRPQILVFMLFAAAWLARTRRGAAGLMLAGCALAILPVTVRNGLVGGDTVLISSEAGSTLWTANHPGADGVETAVPGIRRDYKGLIEDYHAIAERESGGPLRPSQASRYWAGRTLDHVLENPAGFAMHLLRKTRVFLTNWEFGNPEEPLFFAERFVPLVGWLPLNFAMILGLGTLGILVAPRRRGWGLLVSFVVVYSASVILFLIGSRYRLPVVPVLLLFAGQALVWLVQRAQARDLGRLFGGVAFSALVLTASMGFETPREASTANGLYWVALAEARAGNHGQADTLFQQALELRDDFGYLHASRALSLLQLGQQQEALAELERAVELDPLDAVSLAALGALLRQAGDLSGAETKVRRALEIAPWMPGPWFTLGRLHLSAGDAQGANDCFRTALKNDPAHYEAAYTLGVLLLQAGDIAGAVDALRLAVASSHSRGATASERARKALDQAMRARGGAE